MSDKIVSHCYLNTHYVTPDGDFGKYSQLQVVLDDGSIWARVLYWKDSSDAEITKEWRELDIPPLPNKPSKKFVKAIKALRKRTGK